MYLKFSTMCDSEDNDLILVNTLEEWNNLSSDVRGIELGSRFNYPLVNIPQNLEKIIFGPSFNQSIDDLPDTVIYMSLGEDFSQEINKFPSNLEEISFSSDSCKINIEFPDSVKTLEIYSLMDKINSIKKLPSSLEIVDICTEIYLEYFSENINFWMPNVKELTLSDYPDQPIKFPPKIEKLIIGCDNSGDSVSEKLVENFSEYVTSFDMPYKDKIYKEVGIKFGNNEIVFHGQIDWFFSKLLFRNGIIEEEKHGLETTYEECEQFLMKGYNTKKANRY